MGHLPICVLNMVGIGDSQNSLKMAQYSEAEAVVFVICSSFNKCLYWRAFVFTILKVTENVI